MPRNSNVDERVVEMRIDNENFESGANKTISTLEKLERALHLKGDTSGLDDVERAVNNFDASPMTGALEKVQHSFTALEIAGMRVISNLTDSVYNFAAKTVKELTVEPVTQGYDKYQEKLSNVQTIMNATGKSMEEVEEYLNELMWFSDETSFSFTEMTSALSTMTSTGGDINKLIPLLMGVGNAVAYAGKGSNEFVRTIRNLSQSYSGGFLTLMDWRSFQLAGTNSKALQEALIRSAEEMGKIEKGSITLSNFTDSLKDKWADTEVLEKAFGYFAQMSVMAKQLVDAGEYENATEAYKALAEQFDEVQSKAALAAQQAKTFREVIDAIKDAVSTGWMTTFETLFGGLTEASEFWTEMYDRVYALFGMGGDSRNGILDIAFNGTRGEKRLEAINDGLATLQEYLEESGHSMDEFRKAANKVLSSSDSAHFSTLIDRYGSIEEAFRQGAISAETFRQVMAELNGESYEAAEEVDHSAYAMGQSLEELRAVALEILHGDHGNGDERREWLESMGYDYELMQAMVGQLNHGMENISDEQLLDMMEAYYQYNHLADRLGAESFEEYLAAQAAISEEAVRERDEIDELYDGMLGLSGAEQDVVGYGEEFRKSILNILDAIIAVKEVFTGNEDEDKTGAFANVFGSVYDRGKALGELIHRFYELTTHIGFSAEALEGLQKISESFLRVIKGAGMIAGGAFKVVGKAIWEVFEILDDILAMIGRDEFTIGGLIDSVVEHLKNLIPTAEDVQNAFTGIKDRMKEWVSGIDEDKLLRFWDDLTERLKNLKDYVLTGQLFKDIKEYIPSLQNISGLTERIGNYLTTTFPKITERFEEWKKNTNLGTILGGFFGDILQVFSSIGSWISSLKMDTSGLTDTFSQFGAAVSTIFGGLFGSPEEIAARVHTFFDTIKTSVSAEVKDMTVKDWLEAIKTGITSFILIRVGQILKGLQKSTESMGSILDSVKDMFKGAEQMFRDIGTSFKADAIKKIAVAVAILAASLIALSFVPEDKLTHVATTMLMMLGVITLFAKALGGINKIIGGSEKNTGMISGNKVTVFSKFASTLIGFGMVLAAMAGLFLVTRHVPIDKIIYIMTGIGILFAEMAVITKYMSGMKFESPAGAIGSIMAMALALDLMVPVILIFAALPTGRAIQAGLAVVGLLASLAIAADVFSGKDVNGKAMAQAAGAMMMMALALDLLIPIIVIFAALGKSGHGGILGVFLALITLAAALAGLSVVAKKMGDNGAKNMLIIATAIGVLALAMDLMIPAVVAFSAVITGALMAIPWGKITKQLGGFWKAVGKLTLAIVGAAFIAVIIVAIGYGMFLFGAGMVMAGIGAIGLALALGPLAVAIKSFMEGMKAVKDMPFGSIIWNMLRLAVTFGVFALALVGIVWAIKKLTGGGLLGKLISSLGSAGTTITTKISENLPKILDILGTLLIMAGTYLLGIIPNLVETLVQAIVELFSSLADSMEAHREELVESITKMVTMAFGILKDVLKEIFTSDELSFVEKALIGLGTFKVGDSVLHLTDHLKGLFNLITGGGGGGGTGGLRGVIGGANGKGGLIGFLKDLAEAGVGTQGALDGMYMGASGGAWGAAAATAGLAGLAAGAGVYAVTLWDAKISADYTAEALNNLGTTEEDVAAKASELANTWKQGEAALYDYTGASTVSYQEGRYAAAALAEMLGTTVEHLEAEMQATNGNIQETQVYKDAIQALTQAQLDLNAAAQQNRWEQMTENGRQYLAEQNAQIDETTEKTNELNTSLGEMSKTDAFSNLVTQLNEGKIGLDEFKKSVGELDLSFDNLESQIDLSAVKDKFKSEAGNIPAGGKAGIEEKASEFISAITTMDGDGLDAFLSNWGIESPSRVMAAKAAYIPQGAAHGIYDASGSATDAMTNLASRMILAARSVFVEYGPTAGGNAVVGLVNGAYEKIQQAYDAGYNIGKTFMQGYDNATKTRSPSREMMERGIYAVMGLVNGIRSEESYAVEAGYGIGTLLTDAVQEAMSQMALMATDDFAFSPIITPVVDMTNVDNAAGLISGSLGRGSYTLSGQIGNSVSRRLEQANRVASNMENARPSVTSNDNITFNIYASEGMDENAVADAVIDRLGSRYARRGMAYG